VEKPAWERVPARQASAQPPPGDTLLGDREIIHLSFYWAMGDTCKSRFQPGMARQL